MTIAGYATPADMADFDASLTLPTNVDRLLIHASRFVQHATRFALYYVDAAGLPTQAPAIAAMKEATCAQVAYWVKAGIDPLGAELQAKTGAAGPVSSKTLSATGSITYDTSASAAAAAERSAAGTSLCVEAWLVLELAGLLVPVVFSW